MTVTASGEQVKHKGKENKTQKKTKYVLLVLQHFPRTMQQQHQSILVDCYFPRAMSSEKCCVEQSPAIMAHN